MAEFIEITTTDTGFEAHDERGDVIPIGRNGPIRLYAPDLVEAFDNVRLVNDGPGDIEVALGNHLAPAQRNTETLRRLRDHVRSLAPATVDGDGELELVLEILDAVLEAITKEENTTR